MCVTFVARRVEALFPVAAERISVIVRLFSETGRSRSVFVDSWKTASDSESLKNLVGGKS
jgi:hypothetical protein